MNVGFSDRPASPSFLREMNVMDEMVTKNFALDLSDMASLSHYDRMTLVQANWKKVNGFQLAWAYSNQVKALKQAWILCNVRYCGNILCI